LTFQDTALLSMIDGEMIKFRERCRGWRGSILKAKEWIYQIIKCKLCRSNR